MRYDKQNSSLTKVEWDAIQHEKNIIERKLARHGKVHKYTDLTNNKIDNDRLAFVSREEPIPDHVLHLLERYKKLCQNIGFGKVMVSTSKGPINWA